MFFFFSPSEPETTRLSLFISICVSICVSLTLTCAWVHKMYFSPTFVYFCVYFSLTVPLGCKNMCVHPSQRVMELLWMTTTPWLLLQEKTKPSATSETEHTHTHTHLYRNCCGTLRGPPAHAPSDCTENPDTRREQPWRLCLIRSSCQTWTTRTFKNSEPPSFKSGCSRLEQQQMTKSRGD